MAKVLKFDTEVLEEWLRSRPDAIRRMVHSHPPDRLYRLESTGHRVTIYAYNENGTVTVIVSGEYNVVVFPRRVLGIPLSDLTECEPPGPGEPVGAFMELPSEEVIARLREKLAKSDRDEST